MNQRANDPSVKKRTGTGTGQGQPATQAKASQKPQRPQSPPSSQSSQPLPPPVPSSPQSKQPASASWKASRFVLPLRLFLGITFIYAGIQKLTDPQYFKTSAPGYIGRQIAAFATGSPLHNFLVQAVVPHASFFGALIAYGEIAIGLGALVGLLLRPAAFFGLLLNIAFFLTATWRVYPYFYGSDIVFIFCWITLILAGPLNSGLPSLDAYLVPRLLQSLSPQQRAALAQPLSVLIGVHEASTGEQQSGLWLPRQAQPRGKFAASRAAQESRRSFIFGAISGGVGMLVLTWFALSLQSILRPLADNAQSAPSTTGSSSTPGSTSGNVIAKVSAVPANSSVSFTIPSNNDPGILVHLDNGQFVAYDATCTHAGCPVDYDPNQHLLVCPCHGAEFDPAKNGAVVQPPAQTPLTSVAIHIDSSTGEITLQ
ncbi:MAG TPA: TQO small subunit DoxD [Ktedonobacteraceae bacterium]|nr:TQO small subunit DoxD [Ktedonobacteraceae bacterium]